MDMVGNLDEWVSDPEGVFLGGFYSRATRDGCDSFIDTHAPSYYDYSLGTRCCQDP
jgi:formylglycine-generating enzyme required for sulfatase activity